VAAGREHLYLLVGRKPHTNKHGFDTEVLVWRGSCADCTSAFEVSTSSKPPRYLTRRCSACRGTPQRKATA